MGIETKSVHQARKLIQESVLVFGSILIYDNEKQRVLRQRRTIGCTMRWFESKQTIKDPVPDFKVGQPKEANSIILTLSDNLIDCIYMCAVYPRPTK
jgi:hypothetical protein